MLFPPPPKPELTPVLDRALVLAPPGRLIAPVLPPRPVPPLGRFPAPTLPAPAPVLSPPPGRLPEPKFPVPAPGPPPARLPAPLAKPPPAPTRAPPLGRLVAPIGRSRARPPYLLAFALSP